MVAMSNPTATAALLRRKPSAGLSAQVCTITGTDWLPTTVSSTWRASGSGMARTVFSTLTPFSVPSSTAVRCGSSICNSTCAPSRLPTSAT